MHQKTYEIIAKHYEDLNVDLVNGTVSNRKAWQAGNGYMQISLDDKTINLHNVMAYGLYGKQVIGKVVNHLDGDKTNNRANNLELTTHSGNSTHAVATGLAPKPPRKQPMFKADEVRNIRNELNNGVKMAELARVYGCSADTIKAIRDSKGAYANG